MKKIIILMILTLMVSGCEFEVSTDSLLKTYSDENYEFYIGYPSNFKYSFEDQDVIFESVDTDLYYVTSVLLNIKTGGAFNTLLDVQNDYLNQFSAYGAVLEDSVAGTIGGFDAQDFAISYTVEGTEYVNRFIVGKDSKYFYVLQFIVPASQYLSNEFFIGKIIESFEFGEDETSIVKRGIVGGQFDTPVTSPSTPSNTATIPIVPPTKPSESSEIIITGEECYAKYRNYVDEARNNNALQDPASGGISYKYVGLIDSCYSAFETCLEISQAKEDVCWNPVSGSGDANQLCIIQNNRDTLACAEVEINCHESQYMLECGLSSGTTSIVPIPVMNNEAEECYSWYKQHFADLRIGHAAQDPYSNSIGFKYDNTEECWPVVRICNDNAEENYDSCSSQICSTQYNIDKLSCVMLSIECGEEYHKTNCGLI